jgi:hypothetical protein
MTHAAHAQCNAQAAAASTLCVPAQPRPPPTLTHPTRVRLLRAACRKRGSDACELVDQIPPEELVRANSRRRTQDPGMDTVMS